MERAFLHGVHLLNRAEFFECHEALEEIWTPERGPRRLFLQALIHLAVGFYHEQRGNPAGAERQLRKGLRKLAGYMPACESLDTWRLYQDARAGLDCVLRREPIRQFPRIHAAGGSPLVE